MECLRFLPVYCQWSALAASAGAASPPEETFCKVHQPCWSGTAPWCCGVSSERAGEVSLPGLGSRLFTQPR